MKDDCFVDQLLRGLVGACRGDTSRKVWNVGRVAGRCRLDNDRVFHALSPVSSPACLRILFQVPGAKSLLIRPAIVTVPGFSGCWYCRWLPRVRARYQPFATRRRIASLTFAIAVKFLARKDKAGPSPSRWPVLRESAGMMAVGAGRRNGLMGLFRSRSRVPRCRTSRWPARRSRPVRAPARPERRTSHPRGRSPGDGPES